MRRARLVSRSGKTHRSRGSATSANLCERLLLGSFEVRAEIGGIYRAGGKRMGSAEREEIEGAFSICAAQLVHTLPSTSRHTDTAPSPKPWQPSSDAIGKDARAQPQKNQPSLLQAALLR